MPLEVTAGPPLAAVGSGPPGPAGGPTEAAQMPGGKSAPPFAVWLAQQNPQAQPVPGPKSASTVAAEPTKAADKSQKDDSDETDDGATAVPSSPDVALLTEWTALAAQQAPPPPMPIPVTLTADTTVVNSLQTNNAEAMDTAPAVSAVSTAQTAETGRELLPLPATASTFAASSAEGLSGIASPQGGATTAVAPSQGDGVAAPPVAPTDNASAQLQSKNSVMPAVAASAASPATPVALPPGDASQIAVPAQPTLTAAADARAVLSASALPASVVPANVPPIPQAAPAPASEAVVSSTPIVALSAIQATVATLAAEVTPTQGPRLASSSLTTVSREQSKSAPRLAAPNAPAVALTVADVLSTPVAAAQNAPGEKPASITLQNDEVPANNTSSRVSFGDAILPASNTIVPAGEAGDGHTGTAAASTAPVFSPEKAAQKPMISRSSRPKGDDKDEEADPSPTPQTGVSGTDEAGTAVLTAMTPDVSPTATSAPSASVAQTPMTDAERAQIIRQTADGVAAVKPHVIAHGQGQMTLDLHPKEWGDLKVTIRLAQGQAADGTSQTVVTAHVVASSPAVKAALETHTAELNRALHETGLRLDRLTVTVQAASAGSSSGSAGDGGQNFSHQSSDRQSSDQWQATPSQSGVGNGGIGSGGSSSFAAFSERQGAGAFQSQASSRQTYRNADEGDTGITSAPIRPSGISAGFDQRA